MIKYLGKVALTIILFMNVIGPICGLAIWYSDGEGFLENLSICMYDIWEILTWVTLAIWVLIPINYIIAKMILKKKGIDTSDNCDIL